MKQPILHQSQYKKYNIPMRITTLTGILQRIFMIWTKNDLTSQQIQK